MATPVLQIENLSVRFGGVHAVKDFSLTLGPGERVGLIGPNGAGKSTVMNCISGHTTPTDGQIRLAGKPLGRYGAPKRARLGVSRTFQNLALFSSMSVLDNILIALEARERASDLLPWRSSRSRRRAIAMESLSMFGIDDLADQPVEELSYGVCKLLELSRALVLKPPLLLLDEPVAGLSDSRSFVQTLVAALDQLDTTVLLVEHDMSSVRAVCQRVHVLDTGTTIAEGTFDDVARDARVLEAYLGAEETVE